MNNLIPLPYRRVSVQPYAGNMTEEAIRSHLSGRETYRRTDFIVLRRGEETAIVAVSAPDRKSLFSPIDSVEILAFPETCTYIDLPEVDVGNRSAMAAAAHKLDIGPSGSLVIHGKYDHVNFIHHPDPIVIKVVEVTPPDPPKLYGLAQHVLSYADLPPIRLELVPIDLNDLVEGIQAPAYLVPCRSGGLDRFNAPIYYLDERPEIRHDWLLIGCERSLQFHRHYYGDEPPRIEICPRKLTGKQAELTLLKCCLLEFSVELDGNIAVTPWGADLNQVETALRKLVAKNNKRG